jgi:hypothetical protein
MIVRTACYGSAHMSAPALRPLRVGEILDAGIKLYLSRARTLMGLTAVVVVPFQILNAIVLLSVVSSASEVPHGFTTFVSAQRTTDSAATSGAKAVLLFAGLIVDLLSTAACVKAISDAYLDRPVGLGASLRFAARRLGALVWMDILMVVLLGLAFTALVIPGIWLYAAWSVATPALLIEGVRGQRALGRSRELVRGRWWPVAGVLVVAGVMTALVSGAITGVLLAIVLAGGGSALYAVVVVSLASAVAGVLTRPFQAAVVTVLYYDLRVRREGYDVQLFAEQLGFDQAVVPAGVLAGAGQSGPAGAPADFGGVGGGSEAGRGGEPGGGWGGGWGPDSVGQPGGPPFWPPPPGWSPQP